MHTIRRKATKAPLLIGEAADDTAHIPGQGTELIKVIHTYYLYSSSLVVVSCREGKERAPFFSFFFFFLSSDDTIIFFFLSILLARYYRKIHIRYVFTDDNNIYY